MVESNIKILIQMTSNPELKQPAISKLKNCNLISYLELIQDIEFTPQINRMIQNLI